MNLSAAAIALIVIFTPILPAFAGDDRPSELSPRLNDRPQTSPAAPVPIAPTTATDFFKQAVDKAKQNDLAGAIADFNQAIQLKRDYALAYYNRGTTYANLGNRRSAIADYTQVILLKPNNAYVRYNRGLLRADAGDTQGAIDDFQQAATLFKQQLNAPWQQKALDNVKQLQQS